MNTYVTQLVRQHTNLADLILTILEVQTTQTPALPSLADTSVRLP